MMDGQGYIGATLTIVGDKVLLWSLSPQVLPHDGSSEGILDIAMEDNVYTGWLEYWREDYDESS